MNQAADDNTVTLQSGLRLNFISYQRSDGKKEQKTNGKRRKFQTNNEIEVLTSVISLIDVISRRRITIPVRSKYCQHKGCFDFTSFCQLYFLQPFYYERLRQSCPSRFTARRIFNNVQIEKSPQRLIVRLTNQNNDSGNGWDLKIAETRKVTVATRKLTGHRSKTFPVKCPLCNIQFEVNDLIRDDYMETVLSMTPQKVSSIEINDEGYVRFLSEKKEEFTKEVVSLEVSEEDNRTKKKTRKRPTVIISDSEDYDNYSETESNLKHDETETQFIGDEDDPVIID